MQLLIGFEKEFYLSKPLSSAQLKEINAKLLPLSAKLVEERGKNQYELVTLPTIFNSKQERNVENCTALKRYAQQHDTLLAALEKYSVEFNDAPKPYPTDYGSALQISFSAKNVSKAWYLNVIYCILHHAKEFQQTINTPFGSARLVPEFMAPTHICWGGNNNRTTLVRALNLGKESTRVEYRGVNSNANPANLLKFIIEMVHLADTNKYKEHTKIWGNAYHPQYNLEELK